MLVYFSANVRDMKNKIELYRMINQSIYKVGGSLANGWVEVAMIRGDFNFNKIKLQAVCNEAKLGIEDADCLIAEVTGRSAFGVGFEVALALSINKPVLALVQKGMLERSYSYELSHPSLRLEEYDKIDVGNKIRKFILDGGYK